MADIIYKIRVNRPCRLFIDDEEVMILDENKLSKITLPGGEYLRKVVAIDNKAIYNEAEIILSGASKLETIILDTTGLEEAKRNALPKEKFQIGDLMYKVAENEDGVAVESLADHALTEAIIPEEILFEHYIYEVKEIGDEAFWWCENLTSVTIPSTVTSIRGAAFSGCTSLTSITIPNSVTSIEEWAFGNCYALTSIIVQKNNPIYDSRDNCNAIIETKSNRLIAGCQKTFIPNSVTCIGRSAFGGCRSLTSISIPNSVTSISDEAFNGCKNLTSITIPNSVTSIGDGTFNDCENLTSITIPNSVTSIGEWVFKGCGNLTSVTIPNSVTSIEVGAFWGCIKLTSVTIPNSVTSIGGEAFCRCVNLTSITIPNSVTSIERWAFWGCSSLISLTIPSSVTNIGKDAFPACTKIIRKE